MNVRLLFFLILFSCQDKKSDIPSSQIDTVKKEISKEDSVSVTPEKTGESKDTSLSRESLSNSQIRFILDNLLKPETYLNKEDGVYYIEPGPGVYPIMSHLQSLEDLLGKDEFLQLTRNGAAGKFIQADTSAFQPCAIEQEGNYLFPVSDKFELLTAIYTIVQNQIGEEPDQIELAKFQKTEEKITKGILLLFNTKTDDQVRLILYFSEEKGKTILKIVDARDCSA